MVKTLTKHGNSLALVLDKPILDLMKIDASTPLEITTDGDRLILSPRRDVDDATFRAALDKVNRRYAKTFKRLAK
jgi:antitoxin component of MazEF toxin-antitoxin module